MFVTFDHQQLRRYVLAFGSFFDNLFIVRKDITETEKQRICVPIEYGPKEKWLTHIVQDPDFMQAVAIILPRMSFEMTGINYDGSRKVNSLNQLKFPSSTTRQMARTYIGVPYTLSFGLDILVKFQSDGFQIVEQILPYFTPDLTFALQAVPSLGIVDQVPLTLQSISHTDNYEGDFEKRRIIIWTLGFTMKVFFYGPNRSQGRIEEVLVDIYNTPFADLSDPPIYLETEDNHLLVNEDTTLLVDETTANVYLNVGRVAEIDATAVPADQTADPGEGTAVTTITDNDGDVKRSRTLIDEKL